MGVKNFNFTLKILVEFMLLYLIFRRCIRILKGSHIYIYILTIDFSYNIYQMLLNQYCIERIFEM
jgi:hypothetical protein